MWYNNCPIKLILFVASLSSVVIFSSLGEKIITNKVSSNSNGKSIAMKSNPTLRQSSEILTKKLKRKLKRRKEKPNEPTEKSTRQILNIESFLNNFSFFNKNSNVSSNSGSSSSVQTKPTRFVIITIQMKCNRIEKKGQIN